MHQEKNRLTKNLLTTNKSETIGTQDRLMKPNSNCQDPLRGLNTGAPTRIEFPQNTAKILPSRRGLSLELYFIFLRSSFIMFTLLALMKVYPFYLMVSHNCKKYRSIHGDVGCPLTLKTLFNSELFMIDPDEEVDNSLEYEIYYKNRYLSHFLLLLMVLAAILAPVYQKVYLRKRTPKFRIADFSIIVTNLTKDTTKEDVINLMNQYSEDGSPDDVVSVTLVDARLGNDCRQRRIEYIEAVIKSLDQKKEGYYEGSKFSQEIKKLKKGYQRWLNIYKKELKKFKILASRRSNRHSTLAFVTFETRELAQSFTKNKAIAFRRNPFSYLFSCISCSKREPKVLPAANPEEINWNYIGYSRRERIKSRSKTFIAALLLLLGMIYCIFFIFVIFCLIIPSRFDSYLGYHPFAKAFLVNYLPTFTTTILCNAISGILERYERGEIYLTKRAYFGRRV